MRLLHWLGIGAIVLVALAALAWIVLTSAPKPGALLIRAALDSQSAATKKAMEAHPATGVGEILDQRYDDGQSATLLDVYYPERHDGPRRTLVWMHGGGWLSGDKADAAPYFRLIAAQGYTVVSVGYSLSPEHQYPQPVREVNAALGYLEEHAARLHIDPRQIVIGGDSAGAQLASQVAALTTTDGYAQAMHITPMLAADRLRGTVLDCGVYDAEPFVNQEDAPDGPLGFAVATLLWAYAGTKDWSSPVFREMSTLDHVTADFPPTFITGGNADPLTDPQSRVLAARLDELGVRVESRFFAADHQPELPHEYQFDLDTADGQDTLNRTIAFLGSVTRTE